MVNYNHPPKNSPHFDGKLYQKMNEDLQLAGMSKRTVHGYLRAVRQLADYCQTRPNKITETQLRQYFLYLKNEKQFAYGSIRVAFSGIKFFYTRTCKRSWETLATMKLQQAKTLPEVLTSDQVHQIIDACTTERIAVYFWTVYSMGLRLDEARNLQVGDIQSRRGFVHIHRGGVKLDEQGQPIAWQSTAKNFLFHHATLIEDYKEIFEAKLQEADLYDKVPALVWDKDFVVDIKPVGHAEPTLKYLAPYVHRVAISDKRIVSVDESSVKYTVRPSKSDRTTTRKVDGETFVRSFAQHVLPAGFMKIRHYGWMSGNSTIGLDDVKWLVWLYLGWTYWLASGHAPRPEPLTGTLRCAACGGAMNVIAVTFDPMWITASDRALSYFDSG